jgi:hypothetical protein
VSRRRGGHEPQRPVDAGELDPNDPADDLLDTDGDGITDDDELSIGTNPNDADSDDDGVLDGAERDFFLDTDGDGRINALDPDSDNDGLFDGTETGVTAAHSDTDHVRRLLRPRW